MASNNATNTSSPVSVAQGGTGTTTNTTAYAVLCAGTTATGAQQSVASVGTSGQVLTSNGAGTLPTFQSIGASGGNLLNIQTFQTAGSFTYTPTVGMAYCIVYCVGGGGGGANGGSTGSNGGTSSLGALISATGGGGGKSGGSGVNAVGGVGSGGFLNCRGQSVHSTLDGLAGCSFFGGNGYKTGGASALPGIMGGGGSNGSGGNCCGGGGGGLAIGKFTSADIGASKAVTIGSGGAGAGAGSSNGGAGVIVVYEYT